MHHQVCLKCALLTRSSGPDNKVAGTFLYPFRFGPKLNVNAKFASSLNELINEFRVKERKGPRAAVHDGDL